MDGQTFVFKYHMVLKEEILDENSSEYINMHLMTNTSDNYDDVFWCQVDTHA